MKKISKSKANFDHIDEINIDLTTIISRTWKMQNVDVLCVILISVVDSVLTLIQHTIKKVMFELYFILNMRQEMKLESKIWRIN